MGYALRILRNGTCDGCALGTYGMKDWTMDGIHLCWIRLNMLRLNTMPPFDPRLAEDASRLAGMSEKELRHLGRVPVPMVRHRGDKGFAPVTWDEAIDGIAAKIKATDPKRFAVYMTSRGIPNESYYVFQKTVRAMGTNHIDNSARICHAASTTGLKQTIGYGATIISYTDLIGCDLIVLAGSNVANNEPVVMKYLYFAKEKGAKVVVINPYSEPGLKKYWVPSVAKSELSGTDIADSVVQVSVGGDIAFLNGVLKFMIDNSWIDREFIEQHTTGWQETVEKVKGQTFEELERYSGTTRQQMYALAKTYAEAKSAIFIWSMGLTQHKYGTSNVKAIVNLALARGMVGKENCGLMPIRGHSGVQGGAEMGAVPSLFPGGVKVDDAGAHKFGDLWGFRVPEWKGYFVAETVDAAARGEVDVLYCLGSNLYSVLPDSNYVREAVEKIPMRVHADIVLNPQMFLEPKETVYILPMTTRYEMAGGNCETSTERRVIFNPEIPGPRVAGARDDWRVIMEIAKKVRPEAADKIGFQTTAQIREEIGRTIPNYKGIEKLSKKGDNFQWGGPRLCVDGRFNMPDGRGRFSALSPPQTEIPAGWLRLTMRRGKQFNSMVWGQKDVLANGAERDAVMMCAADISALGLTDGEPVLVRSGTGELNGRVKQAEVSAGTAMMYWPEANVLIRRGLVDPECGIPAYKDEVVQVLPRQEEEPGQAVPPHQEGAPLQTPQTR